MVHRAVLFHPSKEVTKWFTFENSTVNYTAQKKIFKTAFTFLLVGDFFPLFIVAHDTFLYNTELFALHRGHPPLLVNQLHSFHVLVSICKTLSRGVKRLLCNKFSILKMKQDIHILEHYFFQELGKKELF